MALETEKSNETKQNLTNDVKLVNKSGAENEISKKKGMFSMIIFVFNVMNVNLIT